MPEIALEEAEFFRALGDAQREALRGQLVERRFQRGRVLYFAGDPAESLWALQSGEVRLYKSSSGGRITTLEVLGPGEVFGAVSVLTEAGYASSAEGVSDGVAWCLGRARFVSLLNDDPRLAREVLEIITRRLHSAHERVRSFAHDPAPSRLAQALLRVTRDGGARITRRELAEAAGTTVETAIRVLRGFQRDEIIVGEVGNVSVVDEGALRRIAGLPES